MKKLVLLLVPVLFLVLLSMSRTAFSKGIDSEAGHNPSIHGTRDDALLNPKEFVRAVYEKFRPQYKAMVERGLPPETLTNLVKLYFSETLASALLEDYRRWHLKHDLCGVLNFDFLTISQEDVGPIKAIVMLRESSDPLLLIRFTESWSEPVVVRLIHSQEGWRIDDLYHSPKDGFQEIDPDLYAKFVRNKVGILGALSEAHAEKCPRGLSSLDASKA